MKKTGIILLSSACVASCLTLSVAENSLEPGIRVQKIETAEKALAEEDAPFMGAFAEEEPLLKETEETGDNAKNRQSKETKDSAAIYPQSLPDWQHFRIRDREYPYPLKAPDFQARLWW